MSRRVNRREFVLGATACAAAGFAARKPGGIMEKVGVQLYTVRDSLAAQPQKTIKRISSIGYRNVEVLRKGLDEVLPLLRRHGLNPVSGHFEAPLVTGQWKGWEESFPEGPGDLDWNAAVEIAVDAGLKYMVIAYLKPEERGSSLDYYRRFAEQMNRAGEACQRAEIQLCFHNHAFEFQPMENSSPMAVLMQEFDPSIGLEFDVFWSSVAGVPPESFFREYPGRIPLIHIKDKADGLKQVFHETLPKDSFREVGSGVLDIPAILEAANQAGTRYLFVEQDKCSGDPVDSLKISYDYLKKLAAG